jgi:ribosomal protein L25 (general stress protein Ctc)
MTNLSMGIIDDTLEKIINPPGPAKIDGRRKIQAIVRTVHKTRQCEKLRESGRTPGVLHGKNEQGRLSSTILHVDTKELGKVWRELGKALENTAFDLVLTDEATGAITTHVVTARQLTLNPLTGSPQNINWLKWAPGARMRIPINFKNTDDCVDLKRGSFLIRVNQFVECIVDNVDKMPGFIDVDVSGASKGSVLSLKNMVFPDGCRPSNNVPQGFVAGVIKNK